MACSVRFRLPGASVPINLGSINLGQIVQKADPGRKPLSALSCLVRSRLPGASVPINLGSINLGQIVQRADPGGKPLSALSGLVRFRLPGASAPINLGQILRDHQVKLSAMEHHLVADFASFSKVSARSEAFAGSVVGSLQT